jgi:hypothetical protein
MVLEMAEMRNEAEKAILLTLGSAEEEILAHGINVKAVNMVEEITIYAQLHYDPANKHSVLSILAHRARIICDQESLPPELAYCVVIQTEQLQ